MPQPRTSSGSISSGHVGRSNSGSGLSAGAVAGARSNLGQNAISSKARKVERQRVEQAALERRGGSVADSLGAGMAATEATAYGYPAMHGGMFSGGIAGQAMGAGGGMNGLAGNASKISSTLAMESYRRRMDVCGGAVEGEWDQDRVFQCIRRRGRRWTCRRRRRIVPVLVPTANPPAPPADKPSPLKEPTEALIRASSWKMRLSLFGSPNVKDLRDAGLTRTWSGHLPKWVLESFNDGKSPREPSPPEENDAKVTEDRGVREGRSRPAANPRDRSPLPVHIFRITPTVRRRAYGERSRWTPARIHRLAELTKQNPAVHSV